jgi:arylsulfatase A-like enzyme
LREAGDEADIDLSGYGGVPTRLQVNITGAGLEDGARIDRLEIQVERNRPVDHRARRARDVFVLAIEGARPDEVYGSLSGPAKREYEVLREFLQEALVFERAYAPGAAAVPSHAGWMSSVAPPIHLTINGTFISESQELLPERLARAGYFNTVITANSDVNPDRGLTQGFAKVMDLDGTTGRERAAPVLMTKLLEEYRNRPSPRFGYVVASDTQAPYDPPRELLTLDPPESAPAAHLTHMWVARVQLQKIFPDDEQVRYVRSLYQAEMSVVDRALGTLVSQLDADGSLDDSIVVVMGVHGEEFLEHGSAGHGKSLFEESIRVPLAIRAPTLLAAGRVEEPVDLLDLAPTLTDLLGIEPSPKWQGESLVPFIDDPHPPPRLLISSRGDGSRAALVGDYKLILGPGSSIDSQQFFDLSRDPEERESLRQAHRDGVAVRMLINALSTHLADESRWKRARWGTGANLESAYALDHGI